MQRASAVVLGSVVCIACADAGSSADDTGTEDTGVVDTSGSSTNATTNPTSTTTADPSTTGAADDSTGAPSGPTYAEDVAPILAAHCWSCHVDGGFAPFSLVDYEDVSTLGPSIVAQTGARLMPPWPIDGTGACQSFVDTRWLGDDELATIVAWVDAGSAPGDLALVPDPPSPPTLGEVSTTIALPSYTPAPEPDHPFDDYRCFVVDPLLPSGGTMTAFEVRPGVIEQAHHIVLFSLDSDEAVQQAVAMQDEDAEAGYRCFGSAGVNQSRILGAWTPGVPVVRYPEGTGVALAGARPIVVQMHYNFADGPQADGTTIDIQIADGVTELESVIFVDSDLSIPPGLADHVEESFTTWDGGAVDLVAVFPHMHQLGRNLHVEIGSTCAADVPRYDFHWQETYRYVEPVRLTPGDEVHLQCNFDSTAKDTTTTWGEGSGDEMCAVVFFARPAE